MRIAIFRNISHEIPPSQGYGGTDRGVFELCRELSQQGHECHVFCAKSPRLSALPNVFAHSNYEAAGRPRTDAERERYDVLTQQHFLHSLSTFYKLDCSEPFDIINIRVDSSFLLKQITASAGCARLIYSLHNVRAKSVEEFYRDQRITCTSHTLSQKLAHGNGSNIHVVPYGVDITEGKQAASTERRFPFKYLLSLGAVGPHKGVRSAIRIAREFGLPIIVAGVPFDPRGRDVTVYFDDVIRESEMAGGKFVGEVSEAEKVRLIRDAEAVLFCSGMEDSLWEEPFGRVIAEAGLLGTPVVAFDCPSSRDLIVSGVTGALFDSITVACSAVKSSLGLSRVDIGRESSKRFSTRRFAEAFLEVCRQVSYNNSKKDTAGIWSSRT